jgi:hypothetical protein
MAQLNFTPFVGLNSTRLSEQYTGYAKGGNFGLYGVEIEKTFTLRTYSPITISLMTGVSYLPNGFNQETSYSFSTSGYTYQKTNIETTYWQVPLIARLNWRPSPLIEDWRIFFGGGISYNSLTHAHVEEKAMYVPTLSTSAYYPPPSVSYQDSKDVTDLAVAHSIFTRFELGMKFKHLQVSWRLSFSTQDMYFKGLEKNWQVPANYSFYIKAHDSRGITKEKYSEVVFGWRF